MPLLAGWKCNLPASFSRRAALQHIRSFYLDILGGLQRTTGVVMKSINATHARITAVDRLDASCRSSLKFAGRRARIKLTRQISLLTGFLAIAATANAQFCPQNFDGVTAPALPAGWTASNLAGAVSPWVTSSTSPDTSPNKSFALDVPSIADNVLVSPATPVTAANSSFYFRHSYATESTFDGGVLEISIDGGVFTDLVVAGGSFSVGGYNSTISSSFSSPIAGRMAWSGNSGGFITSGVILPAAALGHAVAVRWRATSDNSVAATGWSVDSILCGAAPLPPAPPPSPWTFSAAYPIEIAGQAMITIGNASYSFGGITTNGVTTAQAYGFNGTSWTPIASLPIARGHAAVASDGQYAYIFGGANTAGTVFTDAYRYNPATNTYTSIAATPTGRWNSAAAYLDGKIYKIGGSTATSGGSPTNAVEVYNVAGDNWSTIAPFPVTTTFALAFVRDQFIFVASGASDSKAFRYDPLNNGWVDVAFADLPQARSGAVIANLQSNAVLAGGSGTSALEWNSGTNTWAALPDMLLPRTRLGGAVLNGVFFAVGGLSIPGSAYSSENQKFDRVFYSGFELYP